MFGVCRPVYKDKNLWKKHFLIVEFERLARLKKLGVEEASC